MQKVLECNCFIFSFYWIVISSSTTVFTVSETDADSCLLAKNTALILQDEEFNLQLPSWDIKAVS